MPAAHGSKFIISRVITVIHQHTPKRSVRKSTSNTKYWRSHIERPGVVYIYRNIRNIRAIKRRRGSRWSTANIRSGMIHLLVTHAARGSSDAQRTKSLLQRCKRAQSGRCGGRAVDAAVVSQHGAADEAAPGTCSSVFPLLLPEVLSESS